MNDLAVPDLNAVTTRGDVERLQDAMRAMPQIELPTSHLFADGMYSRVMSCPAGSLIVGKVHRREHFFILAKGSMRVTTDAGVTTVDSPAVFRASAGTKRAGLALTDCVCINVHRTASTDLDEIEEELIEPDDRALFDARNMLKESLCLG